MFEYISPGSHRYAPDWKDGTTKGGKKRKKGGSKARKRGSKGKKRDSAAVHWKGKGETASTRARFVPQLLPEALCVTTAQFVRSPPPPPTAIAIAATIARKG